MTLFMLLLYYSKKNPTYLRKTKNMDIFNNFIPVFPFGLPYYVVKNLAHYLCYLHVGKCTTSSLLCFLSLWIIISVAIFMGSLLTNSDNVSPLFAQVESRKYWVFHFHLKYRATALRKCFYKACWSHWPDASQSAAIQTAWEQSCSCDPELDFFYHH